MTTNITKTHDNYLALANALCSALSEEASYTEVSTADDGAIYFTIDDTDRDFDANGKAILEAIQNSEFAKDNGLPEDWIKCIGYHLSLSDEGLGCTQFFRFDTHLALLVIDTHAGEYGDDDFDLFMSAVLYPAKSAAELDEVVRKIRLNHTSLLIDNLAYYLYQEAASLPPEYREEEDKRLLGLFERALDAVYVRNEKAGAAA